MQAEAIVAIDMIHIAPWEATIGLMAGAQATLAQGGLYLYGPFREDGAHTAPSNIAFDDSLRACNASWGVRDIEAVAAFGRAHDLHLVERVAMPGNTLSLIVRRGQRGSAIDSEAAR